MNRAKWNPLIDLMLAISFLGMVLTGFILRFLLSPNPTLQSRLWGISRRGWSDLHFWAAAGLMFAIILHVFLHWKWIAAIFRKRFGFAEPAPGSKSRLGLWASTLLTGFVAAFLWAAWAGRSETVVDGETASSPVWDGKKGGNDAVLTNQGDILNLLKPKCLACHGPTIQSGGFRIDREDPFTGKLEGQRMIVPGHPDSSKLFRILAGRFPDPPHGNIHPLDSMSLRQLGHWIEVGALKEVPLKDDH